MKSSLRARWGSKESMTLSEILERRSAVIRIRCLFGPMFIWTSFIILVCRTNPYICSRPLNYTLYTKTHVCIIYVSSNKCSKGVDKSLKRILSCYNMMGNGHAVGYPQTMDNQFLPDALPVSVIKVIPKYEYQKSEGRRSGNRREFVCSSR
jgi:hypothetical protein